MTSHAQEKYQCHLPKLAKKDDLEDPSTLETSALDYLEPLFTGDVCSYRIESYWTYEICHGNYIKQYHEERDGKTSKMQVRSDSFISLIHQIIEILGILSRQMEQGHDSRATKAIGSEQERKAEV